jgi:hypothetical protein
MTDYYVGQPVLITDVNARGRGPYETTVTKVGRKLVYANMYGRDYAFRIEGGVINDNYGHQHIWTLEEWGAKERHSKVLADLREVGVKFDWDSKSLSTETLEKILGVVTNG